MRNWNTNSSRANWLACGIAVVLGLTTLLYIFPPSLGRALSKNGLPQSNGLTSGNAGIPGGTPLLW